MKTLLFLLQKEFKQIFRNRTILAMIAAVPVIQLSILPLAADYEIKNFNLSVVDNDHSTYSQQLIATIKASDYFKLVAYGNSFHQAKKEIADSKADLVLEIPEGFERDLIREKQSSLLIAANAINGIKAGLGTAYLNQIIGRFNQNIRTELPTPNPSQREGSLSSIEVTQSNWYNPHLNYQLFMVPGILAILLTMVGGFLTSLNIVKEKEVGTIEQINVTPIKKHHFILGKLIPFWILGNVVFTLGLFVSWLVYGIVPLGSFLTLYGFVWVYLLSILGFGLLISTYCDTQQQAMLIMFFFMMVFILMGGLFTSIDSMPVWAQWAAKLNPVAYLIEVMRMVIIKGSRFSDILPQVGVMAVFALVLNSWAVLNYRKTS